MTRIKMEHEKTPHELSAQGKLIRDLVARVTNDNLIGRKIKNGEIRKKLVEPEWKVPDCYRLREIGLNNCRAELLIPDTVRGGRILLQLHGGGYIGAMRNVYRSFAGLYSELGKGIPVFTLDYRVAPENPYPAALEDSITAWNWLIDRGWQADEIIVAGDSAGGGLAMALCMYLKKQSRALPAGIIAMSPWTDLTASGPSYTENYEKDVLFGNTRDSLIYNKDYVQNEDVTNPFISPLFGDFRCFPPMLIQVGGDEMLLSDSVSAAKKARAAGAKVRLSIYEGMFHVFQMALLLMPESRRAWEEVGRFLEITDEMGTAAANEHFREDLLPAGT